jgi:hypothetical protein
MTELKPATALPWRVSPAHQAQVQQSSGIARVTDCYHGQQDAAYIVTAANAYPRLMAENEALREALKASLARIEGDFDNPSLMAFGPLTTSTIDDVRCIANIALFSRLTVARIGEAK